jgi:hypothetical protein
MNSFGMMVNYVYDSDPQVVQGRAQRFEESAGSEIHIGLAVQDIIRPRHDV